MRERRSLASFGRLAGDAVLADAGEEVGDGEAAPGFPALLSEVFQLLLGEAFALEIVIADDALQGEVACGEGVGRVPARA